MDRPAEPGNQLQPERAMATELEGQFELGKRIPTPRLAQLNTQPFRRQNCQRIWRLCFALWGIRLGSMNVPHDFYVSREARALFYPGNLGDITLEHRSHAGAPMAAARVCVDLRRRSRAGHNAPYLTIGSTRCRAQGI